MGKAFEKQTKTIQDQGEKQIKAIEDQGEKEIKAIQDKPIEKIRKYSDYDYKKELLHAKQREIFRDIYNDRLDQIERANDKINYNNLNLKS